MRSLDDAWAWYKSMRRLVLLIGRLASPGYWDHLPWELLGRDERFKFLEGDQVERDAASVLSEFDDIAVFVMFSVFESMVRDRVLDEIASEAGSIHHPALIRAAETLRRNIKEGGFYRNVLDLYKGLDHDLVEQINQIRKYRNWVAHGRRLEEKPDDIQPSAAFDRLGKFLDLIGGGPVDQTY